MGTAQSQGVQAGWGFREESCVSYVNGLCEGGFGYEQRSIVARFWSKTFIRSLLILYLSVRLDEAESAKRQTECFDSAITQPPLAQADERKRSVTFLNCIRPKSIFSILSQKFVVVNKVWKRKSRTLSVD